MKKILLLCGASQTVLNFRVGLIQALKDAGWNVSAAVLDSKYKEEIRALPIDRLFCAEQSNRSLNPFALLLPERILSKDNRGDSSGRSDDVYAETEYARRGGGT